MSTNAVQHESLSKAGGDLFTSAEGLQTGQWAFAICVGATTFTTLTIPKLGAASADPTSLTYGDGAVIPMIITEIEVAGGAVLVGNAIA